MIKNSKVIVAGAAVLFAVFLVSTISLFFVLRRERTEKIALQNNLAEVMKQRKKLAEEAEELRLIKVDMEVKLSGVEAQAKLLAENYEKEKSHNEAVSSQLNKKAEELAAAGAKLKSLAGEKETLKEMLDDEKAKYSELKERVDKLVEVKGMLEEKVRNIVNKQGIELERIVVKAEGDLEGKVVVVNRDFNFVVVDIGLEDDIELGGLLTVFREGKYVGEVQVEKIYDTMSAAAILKETKPKAIMVGDNVVVRRN